MEEQTNDPKLKKCKLKIRIVRDKKTMSNSNKQ